MLSLIRNFYTIPSWCSR